MEKTDSREGGWSRAGEDWGERWRRRLGEREGGGDWKEREGGMGERRLGFHRVAGRASGLLGRRRERAGEEGGGG
jgi:hypothetical protein